VTVSHSGDGYCVRKSRLDDISGEGKRALREIPFSFSQYGKTSYAYVHTYTRISEINVTKHRFGRFENNSASRTYRNVHVERNDSINCLYAIKVIPNISPTPENVTLGRLLTENRAYDERFEVRKRFERSSTNCKHAFAPSTRGYQY